MTSISTSFWSPKVLNGIILNLFQVKHLSSANEALGILRVSSCMGHTKSQYMAGIMSMIGVGVPQDKPKVRKCLHPWFCSSSCNFSVLFFPPYSKDYMTTSKDTQKFLEPLIKNTFIFSIFIVGLEVLVAWSSQWQSIMPDGSSLQTLGRSWWTPPGLWCSYW